jgi:hypothetical protein
VLLVGCLVHFFLFFSSFLFLPFALSHVSRVLMCALSFFLRPILLHTLPHACTSASSHPHHPSIHPSCRSVRCPSSCICTEFFLFFPLLSCAHILLLLLLLPPSNPSAPGTCRIRCCELELAATRSIGRCCSWAGASTVLAQSFQGLGPFLVNTF